jgi:hypothetical protein
MEKIFDALYTRLLLRDAFGKVLPGIVWLSAIVGAGWGLGMVATLSADPSLVRGLLLLGLSWVVGFAVQSAGKMLRPSYLRIETFPPAEFSGNKEFTEQMTEFHRIATDREAQAHERYAIVKEAAGNMYMAVLLAVMTLTLDWLAEAIFLTQSTYPALMPAAAIVVPLAALVLAALALRRQHFQASARQAMVIKAVLARSEAARSGTEGTSPHVESAGRETS